MPQYVVKFVDGPRAGQVDPDRGALIYMIRWPIPWYRESVTFEPAIYTTISRSALRLAYECNEQQRDPDDDVVYLLHTLTDSSREDYERELLTEDAARWIERELHPDYIRSDARHATARMYQRDRERAQARRATAPPRMQGISDRLSQFQQQVDATVDLMAQPRAYVTTRDINNNSPFVVPAGWTVNERGDIIAPLGAPQETPVPAQEPESRPPRSVDAIMAEFADRNIHVRHYLGRQRIELREGLTNRGTFSDHREVEGAICELMAVTPAEYEAFRQHVSNLLAGWARSIPAPERSAAAPGSEGLCGPGPTAVSGFYGIDRGVAAPIDYARLDRSVEEFRNSVLGRMLPRDQYPPDGNVVLRNVRRVTDPMEYDGHRLEAEISALRADQFQRSGVGHRRDDTPGVLFVWRADQQCGCQQCNESRRLLVPELRHPREARYIRANIV